MTPTLIISNDFPPTIGGIEGFVCDLCNLLDDQVIVLTRRTPGWRDHDRQLPYRVYRHAELLAPTPRVGRIASELITEHRIRSVIFGAMAPLALLAPQLRVAGARRMLAISHGHETWWASLPGSNRLLRRMADHVDRISVISDYTRSRIEPSLSSDARSRLIRLPPPIDPERFRPGPGEARERPRCIAVGRMVRQKNFAGLIRAWRAGVDHGLPEDAELLLVGDGPQASALHRLVDQLGVADSVRFTGAVPRARVPDLLRTATVFALPVRTQLAGLNPEGLGLGFAEAAASGLPVIVGRSGGAPETVRHGRTGYLVQPDDTDDLARRITELLTDPERAAAFGRAGRDLIIDRFGADQVAATLRTALG